jgi:hypothetical protein
VATAKIPSGAVASELANDGKKNTTFFEEQVDLGIGYSHHPCQTNIFTALLGFVRILSRCCHRFVAAAHSCPAMLDTRLHASATPVRQVVIDSAKRPESLRSL